MDEFFYLGDLQRLVIHTYFQINEILYFFHAEFPTTTFFYYFV